MSAVVRLVTAEEFARMPESSHDRYELVEGRLVRISRPNFDHGRIVVQLAHLLKTRLESREKASRSSSRASSWRRIPTQCEALMSRSSVRSASLLEVIVAFPGWHPTRSSRSSRLTTGLEKCARRLPTTLIVVSESL